MLWASPLPDFVLDDGEHGISASKRDWGFFSQSWGGGNVFGRGPMPGAWPIMAQNRGGQDHG